VLYANKAGETFHLKKINLLERQLLVGYSRTSSEEAICFRNAMLQINQTRTSLLLHFRIIRIQNSERQTDNNAGSNQSHLLSGRGTGVRGRGAAAALPAAAAAGPPTGRRRAQEPGQPLLPRAPEVLDVVVRAAGQVRGDPGPLVAELSLQVDHHALLLGRELAAPSHRKRH